MSKLVKELQMKVMRETFHNVRDLVLLSPNGLAAIPENKIRLDLRKKNIRMMLVKNALARRVLSGMGIDLQGCWEGPTMVAWGSTSIADLSKELEKSFKGNPKVAFKTAVADGSQVSFDQALKFPTREEAIGRVVGLAMAPASNLLSSILGPASQLLGQIKSMGDEKKEEEGAPPPEPAA
jgi:large subunit ribosomal protein L10